MPFEIDLFPIAEAQGVDATAQPTFGPIEVGGGNTATSSILLKSDKTSVVVSELFTVKVEIKTNDLTINEYRIVIDFDPARLSIIDQDTTTPGTQIKLLDTVFQVENIEQDNNISEAGRVRLVAKTPTGNPFSVNRDVAEVTFQAQAIGSPTIKVTQGTTGSQLVRQTGVGISYTPNQLTIQVATQTTTTPPPPDQTNNGNTTPPPVLIPDTAVARETEVIITLIISFLLLLTGVRLFLERKKKDIWDK